MNKEEVKKELESQIHVIRNKAIQDLDKAIALLDCCKFFPEDGIRQEFDQFETFNTHLANLTEYTTDVVRFVKILQDEEYKKMYEQLEALFAVLLHTEIAHTKELEEIAIRFSEKAGVCFRDAFKMPDNYCQDRTEMIGNISKALYRLKTNKRVIAHPYAHKITFNRE